MRRTDFREECIRNSELQQFTMNHSKQVRITTKYFDSDNLGCEKVTCEEADV